MLKKLLVLILPLAIVAGGWYFLNNKTTDSSTPSLTQSEPVPENKLITNDSGIAVENSATTTRLTESDSETDVASAIVNDISQSNQNRSLEPVSPNPQSPVVDATTVAVDQRLSDEEFEQLEAMMRNDRNLRLQILDEFRYNTDPERAKQLASLLGVYDDPEILQTASELVYSGDPQSKTAGLDLLRRIQPRNVEARDIAIDLLSSESDVGFLVSTLNVLATPTRTATAEQRQLLNTNLNNLVNHYDPGVRSHSLSLMGRWDKNSPANRESLTQGLIDADPTVRSSAAYAIKNIQNPDVFMIDGLISIAEDTTATKSTRYAALNALAEMNLSGTHVRRYNIAKRNVSRRVATSGN